MKKERIRYLGSTILLTHATYRLLPNIEHGTKMIRPSEVMRKDSTLEFKKNRGEIRKRDFCKKV